MTKEHYDRPWVGPPAPRRHVLVGKFIEPPFSVFDATSVRWQARRAEWLSLGIRPALAKSATVADLGAATNPRAFVWRKRA